MPALQISIVEPFTSPTWESNFAVFSGATGIPILEEEAKAYIAKACRYAKKFNVYLVPERFITLGNQSMCLISPEGKVLGAQQAIFENPAFPSKSLSSKMDVWPTPFGNVFLAVDVDIYRPEVPKIAYNLEARIVISSQTLTPIQFSNHQVVSGVWNAAQSNHLFVVGACNQFCCVCAPREITHKKDGFIAAPTTKLPLSATLPLESLAELPENPRLSRGLYARHKKELTEEPNNKK